MAKEIKMPQLGQTSDEVRLIRWLVKEGDFVKRGQPLCEVETDKVTMEFESVAEGVVQKLNFLPDSQIKTGDIIAIIDDLDKADIKTVGVKKANENDKIKIVSEVSEVSEDKDKKDISPKVKENDVKSIKKDRNFLKLQELQHKVFEQNKLVPIDIKQKRKIISEIGIDSALEIYKKMLEIREFEEAIKVLFLEGKMPGTIHQYIGMEACAVGVCTCLKKDDVIASTHRPHGHAIARGLSLKEIMAELYGKISGCCKGKGGSMHVGNLDKGMLPAIAIVGANIPIVGGMALAFKLKGEKRVAVSFFGDGASNEGAFHEGINMAAVYEIPAVFVCENNQYGASTHIKKTLKLDNIADRAYCYGIRPDIADGMDVLDVYAKAKVAIDLARENYLPTLLELKTFRLCGHSRRDPCNYMSKEEKEYWQSRDPLPLYETFLLSENIADKDIIDRIKNEVKKEVDDAIIFAQNSPDPDPEDTLNDLYIDMEVPR